MPDPALDLPNLSRLNDIHNKGIFFLTGSWWCGGDGDEDGGGDDCLWL